MSSIRKLTEELKINWRTIKAYLDSPADILPCGVKMPLMKKYNDKEMYLISEVKGYLEMKNYSNMSKEVIDNLKYMDSFRDGYEGVHAKSWHAGRKY